MKKSVLFLSFFFCLGFSLLAQNTIDNSFFTHVTYSGAFGNQDWTAGWANFDPQNTVYPGTTITVAAGDITTNTTWSPSASPLNGAASFSDAYLSSSFFEPVSYTGAFGPIDWTAGWANFNPQSTSYPLPTVTIAAGHITTNTTWTSNNTYLLNGFVYVDSLVTLTIQAGTIIRGDKNNQGALIVKRGGKLIANGTASAPIVFTSNQAAGSRDYGDWGGVVICGAANTNVAGDNVLIEGGVGAYYGGQNDADNSGSLKYVRIEFPGIAFSPNNEINGLTMGAVGSGTTIDYVQVAYSGDDAFEWFGGTVNAKHLIALAAWDDDFDTDFGFTGKVQFGVSLRDPNIADVSGSNSFESDNDGSGSTNSPRTHPIFSNISSFGPLATTSTNYNSNYKRAMHLRRSTRTSIFNSVFAGWPTGLNIDGNNTQADATNDVLKIENTYLVSMTNNYEYNSGQTWTSGGGQAATYFQNAARNNSWTLTNSQLLLVNPFNLTAPNFLPSKNVYLLNGWLYVKSGATLTIQPGTIIRGDKTNKGSIIVERGAQIIANGNANEPIVFTSNQPTGARNPGDWGGIVICGYADINQGLEAVIEGNLGSLYGGTNDADNSGSLKYVRIEYAGVAYTPNNEINSLTMGGVGSGTTLDYIQVSYAGDDAFEWFGGNVNAKHLIAYGSVDDDFDTDNGFRGMIQFAVSLRDGTLADVSGSNAFESDNDAAGSTNTPLTNPLFSNVSIFGPRATPSSTYHANFKRGMHIRRNSRCSVYNSLFMGFPTGMFIDGTLAQNAADANELQIENTFLAGMVNNYEYGTSGQTWTSGVGQAATYFENASRHNSWTLTNAQMLINDPFTLTAPNFLPTASSPVLNASRWVKGITGKIEYENTALTDLSGCTVTCKDAAGNIISNATTNATGDYSLSAIDGVFNLYVDCNKAWGGLSMSDVIRARQALVSAVTLTTAQGKAADVNLSGALQLQDIVAMRQRIANLNPAAWIAPNYVFEPVTLTITTGSGATTQNIKGLCAGDVNGSYTPVSK